MPLLVLIETNLAIYVPTWLRSIPTSGISHQLTIRHHRFLEMWYLVIITLRSRLCRIKVPGWHDEGRFWLRLGVWLQFIIMHCSYIASQRTLTRNNSNLMFVFVLLQLRQISEVFLVQPRIALKHYFNAADDVLHHQDICCAVKKIILILVITYAVNVF